MQRRFLTIWFRYLLTDWFTLRNPDFSKKPFVLAAPDHGRMVITAVNALAQKAGAHPGLVVADARVLIPGLEVLDDKPGLAEKLLAKLAAWCIRFTPHVAVDPPDGLKLDITGCAHLWGGEQPYLNTILIRLKSLGFDGRSAVADTIGTAWAMSRYGHNAAVIESGQEAIAIQQLPPAALRIQPEIAGRFYKLGLFRVQTFLQMPQRVLRRRFGQEFILRLNQALGKQEEWITPVMAEERFEERLPCLEPIVTAVGIQIALERLLEALCSRLQNAEQGLRKAIFKCYRLDGKMSSIEIGTNRPSQNSLHLFKLFENKLATIEPDLGIELFVLEAPRAEPVSPLQKTLWENNAGLNETGMAELLDRIGGRIGAANIHRYLPDEHYWPERSYKTAVSITDKPTTNWKIDKPRPLLLLSKPDRIEVTAPIPDYPPMLFRYKEKVHKITRADGPERIEQEWWLQQGEHRDYYAVEDETGQRYWLFRLGHYTADRSHQWFLHGFFC